jgi:hypothetical protein
MASSGEMMMAAVMIDMNYYGLLHYNRETAEFGWNFLTPSLPRTVIGGH